MTSNDYYNSINGASGGVDPSVYSVFGWAYSTTAVDTPSDPFSNMIQHDDARLFGRLTIVISAATTKSITYVLLGSQVSMLQVPALAAIAVMSPARLPPQSAPPRPALLQRLHLPLSPSPQRLTSASRSVGFDDTLTCTHPFSYVVVGAGNCGLVVADRLSKDLSFRSSYCV